jgi:hypothetical protein
VDERQEDLVDDLGQDVVGHGRDSSASPRSEPVSGGVISAAAIWL